MLIASMSGLPNRVESVKELDQKPSKNFLSPSFSNIKFSVIIADIGLCASINLKIFLFSRFLFNEDARTSGEIPILYNPFFKLEDEIFLVYHHI